MILSNNKYLIEDGKMVENIWVSGSTTFGHLQETIPISYPNPKEIRGTCGKGSLPRAKKRRDEPIPPLA